MEATQVAVIGAGISGIACARTLADAGMDVVVLDRGRHLGGRMAVRTDHGRPVDVGASYFTVADPAFDAVVRDWVERGLARPWTDTLGVYEAGSAGGGAALRASTGPMRWAGSRGLRSLVENLAEGLDVRQVLVSGVGPGPTVDGDPVLAAVLAMPDPQGRRLLHPDLTAEGAALSAGFEPVLVLTAAWPSRGWDDNLDGLFVNGDDQLSWIADDGRRRGDGAPVLVAHSTPATAAAHLHEPEQAAAPMLRALRRILSIRDEPTWTQLQRWTYARPTGTRSERYLLTDDGISACGDGWSDKPRVEAAYLSGIALGTALVARYG